MILDKSILSKEGAVDRVAVKIIVCQDRVIAGQMGIIIDRSVFFIEIEFRREDLFDLISVGLTERLVFDVNVGIADGVLYGIPLFGDPRLVDWFRHFI